MPPAWRKKVTKTRTNKAPLTRSETMARVRSENTAPEIVVRRALHGAGLRYALHRSDLPGHPDIVLPARRAVVLVHGCFWHGHEGCARARVPSTRQDYWLPKLQRNKQRDAAAEIALSNAGWSVHVVWECEIRKPRILTYLAAVLLSARCEKRRPLHASSAFSSVPLSKPSNRTLSVHQAVCLPGCEPASCGCAPVPDEHL